jgi:predicted transcriptional regulator
MTIADIANLLNADFCCGKDMAEREIQTGCAYDMMSDVLAYGREHAVLLTCLLNPQVIRTAEMMDIFCVVFVMGKQPTKEMIELAQERSLIIMTTKHPMFSACGILYKAGVPDGSNVLGVALA